MTPPDGTPGDERGPGQLRLGPSAAGRCRRRIHLDAAHPDRRAPASAAARRAFDRGPWPQLTHAERAGYLRAMAENLETRAADYADIWPRESGVVHAIAQLIVPGDADNLRFYADLVCRFAKRRGTHREILRIGF